MGILYLGSIPNFNDLPPKEKMGTSYQFRRTAIGKVAIVKILDCTKLYPIFGAKN
jgi:hypothetical protein